MATDFTYSPEHVKIARSKRHMLWFSIISLCMTFAGLTSAFIVSSKRRDWLNDFQMPDEFLYSTIILLLSSIVLWVGQKAVATGNNKKAAILTVIAFILGAIFVYLQFDGFARIADMGYFFTGGQSNITTTFVMLIAAVHLLHIAAALIVLLVITVRTLQGKYTPAKWLGYELGATFWHFVDVLWILLFVFMWVFFYFQTA